MRLNIEYKEMTNFAPDYEKLRPLQKLEVFEHGLSETDGQVRPISRGRRKLEPVEFSLFGNNCA